jgi:hypothetical protein
MKKKITYDDWIYINKYNYAAKWLRHLCVYTLTREPNGRFRREQRIGWPVYLILFIPVHILQAISCIWDGGLKEFEIIERYLGGDWTMPGCEPFDRAKEVWESINK